MEGEGRYTAHCTATYWGSCPTYQLSRFLLPHQICTVWWVALLGASLQPSSLSGSQLLSPGLSHLHSDYPSLFSAEHLLTALPHVPPWIYIPSPYLKSTKNMSSHRSPTSLENGWGREINNKSLSFTCLSCLRLS